MEISSEIIQPDGVLEVDSLPVDDSSLSSTQSRRRKRNKHLNSEEFLLNTPKKRSRSKKLAKHNMETTNSTVLQEMDLPQAENEFNKEMVPLEPEENGEVSNNILEETIDWPQQDFQELVSRIEVVIPEKDNLSYSTRVEKINWDEIAFNKYSGEKCKKAWIFIQRKIRKYRLLNELLQDAKEILIDSWPNFYQNKAKRHPDMPKRPRTVYLIYYMKKREKILLQNPGIDTTELAKITGSMFKNLSTTKREKYVKLAAEERKNYDTKLEEFYQNHPEVSRNSFGALPKLDTTPKKPQTPFVLYYEEQLKMLLPEDDRNSFKEKCKEQWKNLPDKKKLIWIDMALENEAKYTEEMKKYVTQNGTSSPSKPILTKEEKLLKDRLAGKPKKPPTSAYGVFTQMMMRNQEMKKIETKHRLKSIGEQWNQCSDAEKMNYRSYSDQLMEEYKEDYSKYLDSLPEDQRKQEIEKNSRKQKKSPNETDTLKISPKKKRKSATVTRSTQNNQKKKQNTTQEQEQSKENQPEDLDESTIPKKENELVNVAENAIQNKNELLNIDENTVQNENLLENTDQNLIIKKNADEFFKMLQNEPPSPPKNGFELFSTRYHGRAPLQIAWRKLSTHDKNEYENEVNIIKENFIKEYEKYLKSLTQEQLTLYFQLKKKVRAAQELGGSTSGSAN